MTTPSVSPWTPDCTGECFAPSRRTPRATRLTRALSALGWLQSGWLAIISGWGSRPFPCLGDPVLHLHAALALTAKARISRNRERRDRARPSPSPLLLACVGFPCSFVFPLFLVEPFSCSFLKKEIQFLSPHKSEKSFFLPLIDPWVGQVCNPRLKLIFFYTF